MSKAKRGKRDKRIKLMPMPFKPWAMQRKVMRSRAITRVLCCARQVGKTHLCAHLMVRYCIERPGSTNCILMPTYKSTKGALKHLRRELEPLGEGRRWKWHEMEKRFSFRNGTELYLRTADQAKDGVPTRGLTIDVLWVDEAAFVSESVVDASRATQISIIDPPPVVLMSSTPAGLNYFHDEFYACWPPSKMREAFRVTSLDSPFTNAEYVRELETKMGKARAAQELRAAFIGSQLSAFEREDVAALFRDQVAFRGSRFVIGIDLGKSQDYTWLTLANEFLDAWTLDRFQGTWPSQRDRIIAHLKEHDAIACVDAHSNGGYGGAICDFIAEAIGDERVIRYRLGGAGKTRLIEELKADIEARKPRIQRDTLGEGGACLMESELIAYEAHRSVDRQGQERWIYRGPDSGRRGRNKSGAGVVHDDSVISLALAMYAAKNAPEPAGPVKWHAQPNPRTQGRRSAPSAIHRQIGGTGGDAGGYRFK